MAAGPTFEPLATTTLGSAASSITFSSIASTYTDLRLIIVEIAAGNYGYLNLRFNSDTGSNYSGTVLRGNGSTASSARDTSATSLGITYDGIAGSTNPGLYEIDIFNYAGSTYKTLLASSSGDQNGSGFTYKTVGLWRSTSAINTIAIRADNWNFAAGTTATIYGIKSA